MDKKGDSLAIVTLRAKLKAISLKYKHKMVRAKDVEIIGIVVRVIKRG